MRWNVFRWFDSFSFKTIPIQRENMRSYLYSTDVTHKVVFNILVFGCVQFAAVVFVLVWQCFWVIEEHREWWVLVQNFWDGSALLCWSPVGTRATWSMKIVFAMHYSSVATVCVCTLIIWEVPCLGTQFWCLCLMWCVKRRDLWWLCKQRCSQQEISAPQTLMFCIRVDRNPKFVVVSSFGVNVDLFASQKRARISLVCNN